MIAQAVVVWSLVGGGSIDQTGFYRAPTTASGPALVIARCADCRVKQADTAVVQIVAGGGALPGIPYGHYNAWTLTAVQTGDPFSLGMGNTQPIYLPALLANLRDRGLAAIVNLWGGGAESYLTNGRFDLARWRAQLQRYAGLTGTITEAHQRGQLLGLVVMDEPHNPKWGGGLSKATVDQMCAEVQQMFPGVPVGVTHQHDRFDPDRRYVVCDFLVNQYVHRKGDASAYLASARAYAERDGIAMVFSLNILDGGIQAERDAGWQCGSNTGGRGTFDPNCRMTAQQVRAWGLLFGPHGCALLMWRRESDVMGDPGYRAAFEDVASELAALPRRECRR